MTTSFTLSRGNRICLAGRYTGYSLARGGFCGTCNDRIDRWYIDDDSDTTLDRRGPGHRTRAEALDTFAEENFFESCLSAFCRGQVDQDTDCVPDTSRRPDSGSDECFAARGTVERKLGGDGSVSGLTCDGYSTAARSRGVPRAGSSATGLIMGMPRNARVTADLRGTAARGGAILWYNAVPTL